MKHADSAALDRLEPLLAEIRQLAGTSLKERARGVFYRQSRAFLHFHTDPAGLFADLRRGEAFERFPLACAAERSRFLAALRETLQA
ncbi:hypothetical protein [Burkholderia gladioli]|uniref:hypothetical protein n=1 Tax=Burkholderia gladioli TaxID=28095 RepID=UPI0026503FAB|nr:hypothetical protein [Burkholderia gladioli]MDN7753248.1 hypothetical protein [Burkholderia gladioli]